MKTRVVVIGIGGATCSGKTTLATQLSTVLPKCIIIHQDDYWSDPQHLPLHPVYNIPDAEDARGAINWPRFRAAVKDIRSSFRSIDFAATEELNKSGVDKSESKLSVGCLNHATETQPPIMYATPRAQGKPPQREFGAVCDSVIDEWNGKFRRIEEEWLSRGVRIQWCIVEGFVLYYDAKVVKNLDVQLFIRSPGSVLQKRRLSRQYTSSDGSAWKDPPHYWEHIAYPAYIRAHSHLFHGGDVDAGPLSRKARSSNLIVLDGEGTAQALSSEDIFQLAARSICEQSQPRNRGLLGFWGARW